jgi:hypothetical protein
VRKVKNSVLIIGGTCLILLSMLCCTQLLQHWNKNQPTCNTLRSILSSPSDYHLKKVVIEGFDRCQFEGNSLFFSEQALANLDRNYAVWVDIDENALWRPKFKAYKGQKIRISGVYSSEDCGHGALFRGSIHNIDNIELIKGKN